MDAFNEAANKLEHVHISKIVKLNVGGHLFSTSLETLTKDPGSMLHAMFSGRFETKPSEDRSYFIDRDGTHFRYILNYLRTGQLIVPEEKIVRRELMAEAKFYQVQGIINELEARPITDSTIIRSDLRQTLYNWLKEVNLEVNLFPVLLYRGSRDGWTGANLHSCCDNKGATLIVVQATYNYVQRHHTFTTFGGYTEQQWEQCASEVTIERPDSFKFKTTFQYGDHHVRINAPNDSNNLSVSLDKICTNKFSVNLDSQTFTRYTPHPPATMPSQMNPPQPLVQSVFSQKRPHSILEMEVYGFEKGKAF